MKWNSILVLVLSYTYHTSASICQSWCLVKNPICTLVCGDVLIQSEQIKKLTETLNNTVYNLQITEELLLNQSLEYENQIRTWRTQLFLADRNTTWSNKIKYLNDKFETCSTVLREIQTESELTPNRRTISSDQKVTHKNKKCGLLIRGTILLVAMCLSLRQIPS
jgi:hypothetical protein